MTLALFTSGGTTSMTTPRGSSGATPRLRGQDLLEMTPGLAEIDHDIEVHDVVPVLSASLQLATVLDIVRQASELVAGDHTGAILTQGTDTLEEVPTWSTYSGRSTSRSSSRAQCATPRSRAQTVRPT